MPNPKEFLKVTLAVLCSALALVLPLYILSNEQCIVAVKYYSYWLLVLTTGLFIFYFLKSFRATKVGPLLQRLKDHLPVLFVILAATCYLQLHVDHGFKILFDEHVLSATARSMYEDNRSYVPAAAHVINGETVAQIGFVDKRPGFFPFVLSLIHSLTGYRPDNVFWLNTLLSGGLLSLVYAVIASITRSKSHGVLAILLFTSLPLFAQNATGGGFELMNLCLICCLILAGCNYMKQSGSNGLNLLIMIAVLLANTRYESILYTLVPVLLFSLKAMREKHFKLTWFAAASPLLLIVPILSYAVFRGEERFLQTTPDNYFGLHHFISNWEHAVTYLFEPNGDYTNSLLLSLAGITSVLFLSIQILRRWRFFLLEDIGLSVCFAVSLVTIGLTILALFWFWGGWTDPMTSRFSLPLHLFFALAVPLALHYDFRRTSAPSWMFALTLVFIITQTSPHTVRMQQECRMYTTKAYHWLIQWIQSQENQPRTLYISGSSTGIALFGQSTIPIQSANASPERVMWSKESSIYERICVAEILYHNGQGKVATLHAHEPLSSRFVKEPIAENLLIPNVLVRVSEIKAISPAPPGEATHPNKLPPPIPEKSASLQEWENYFYRGLLLY